MTRRLPVHGCPSITRAEEPPMPDEPAPDITAEIPTTTVGPALTYVRWRPDQSRRNRTGKGFAVDSAVVGHKCPICPHAILASEPWQIIAVGPGDDTAAAAHRRGAWYDAAATVAHLLCAQRVSDPVLDNIAAALLAEGAVKDD